MVKVDYIFMSKYVIIFLLFFLVPLMVKADYIFMSKDVAKEKGYNTKESAVKGVISCCKEG